MLTAFCLRNIEQYKQPTSCTSTFRHALYATSASTSTLPEKLIVPQLVQNIPAVHEAIELIILSQINHVHSVFLKIHFNIIILSTPKSPKGSLSFVFFG